MITRQQKRDDIEKRRKKSKDYSNSIVKTAIDDTIRIPNSQKPNIPVIIPASRREFQFKRAFIL